MRFAVQIRLYHTTSPCILLHKQAVIPLLGDCFRFCETEHVLMTDKQAGTHANQAVLPELNPYICLCEFTSARSQHQLLQAFCMHVCTCMCSLKYYEYICSDALFFLIPLLFATRKDNVGYFARESGFIPRANRVFPLTSCDRSHDYITSSHRPLVQPVLVRYSSLFPQC